MISFSSHLFLLQINTCVFIDVFFFVAVYKFFEQRNVRLRGNPDFAPGAKLVFIFIKSMFCLFVGCEHGEVNVNTSRVY